MLLLLAFVGIAAGELVNIADKGSISATSTGWGGVASRAIDGRTDGQWGSRSCYHSSQATGAKLTLSLPGEELGASWPVQSISVFNRLDLCCDQRIQGVQVWLDEYMCGALTFVEGQHEYTVDCAGKMGSTVTVYNPTSYLQVCELRVFVDDSYKPDIPSYVNVAKEGEASSTSVGWGGVASRVKDGNTNGYWSGGSCSHSGNAANNRVTVALPYSDIGIKYPVSAVRVYNRLDACCDQRIDNVQVFADDHMCGQIKFTEGKKAYMVDCGNKTAGEVSVRLSAGWLQVCELEVLVLEENIPTDIPTFINVAVNGTASSSSIGWGGVASRVIDGNRNGMWGGQSCQHSAGNGGQHSVSVTLPAGDLGVKYPISFINIYNRLDACCDQKINGAMVFADEHQCGQVQFQEGKQSYKFDCGEFAAGQVSVRLSSGQSLHVCEVEVLVLEENMPTNIPKFINVAADGTASSSSIGWGGVASRVIDGNRNGMWGGQSCQHSAGNGGQHSVSVTLPAGDLGVKYPISFINIYNRLDACCDQKINGAMVYADEHQCGQVQFQEGKQPYQFNCGNFSAGVVSVKLSSGQSLHVCEIEVLVLEENMPKNIPVFSNVALGRPAAQSSVGWGGVAARAVDGNTNKQWGGRSCTHSSQATGNWWTVQLDQEQYIQSIKIHNRLDCCSNRINGAKVWVGRGSEWELCGDVNYDGSSVFVIACNKYGDGVKITNDNSYLTLCEVEVLVPEEVPSEVIDEE